MVDKPRIRTSEDECPKDRVKEMHYECRFRYGSHRAREATPWHRRHYTKENTNWYPEAHACKSRRSLLVWQ
jgi:hypothetical protein